MNRREFTKSSVSLLAALPLISMIGSVTVVRKRNVLVLGGRGFLGPRIVNAFLDAGHHVTLLNRGITNPHMFKDLRVIICDREKENKEGLFIAKSEIMGEHWDHVIDTWQKSPKAVADFLEEFRNHFGHYHYISTMSVYKDWDKKYIDEEYLINDLPSFPKTINEEFRYAIRKTISEQIIREKLNTDYTIYRCNGIRSDRTPDHNNPHEEPYWPIRFFKGGEILVPKVENHHIQVTDAKSLADFIVLSSENKTHGVYNVAYEPFEFKDYITALIKVIGEPKKIHWIPGEFLLKNGVLPYQEIEYWRTRPAGAYYFNVNKAIGSGLVNRPVTQMIQDQIRGYKDRYPKNNFEFGNLYDGTVVKLSPDKEKAIINKWLTEQ